MTQVLRPLELGILATIMLVGIFALAAELIEYEEIAKVVVIPSLVFLILVTGYAMFRSFYTQQYRL